MLAKALSVIIPVMGYAIMRTFTPSDEEMLKVL